MPDVKAAEGSASLFLMHATSSTPPTPSPTPCTAWLGYVSLILTQMINGQRITCVFDRSYSIMTVINSVSIESLSIESSTILQESITHV